MILKHTWLMSIDIMLSFGFTVFQSTVIALTLTYTASPCHLKRADWPSPRYGPVGTWDLRVVPLGRDVSIRM